MGRRPAAARGLPWVRVVTFDPLCDPDSLSLSHLPSPGRRDLSPYGSVCADTVSNCSNLQRGAQTSPSPGPKTKTSIYRHTSKSPAAILKAVSSAPT